MKHQFSPSFFLFLGSIMFATLVSNCQSANKNRVETYFNENQRDTLLVNMITFMARYAPGATNETRYAQKYRTYYAKQLPKYTIEKYRITPDSTHYFFVIRPVGEGRLFQRGVGGRFKLKNGLLPTEFEEIWCTPHIKDVALIKERGGFLFQEMVKNGNVDKYLNMKDYIEWPDSMLIYDKQKHEWVATPKARGFF